MICLVGFGLCCRLVWGVGVDHGVGAWAAGA